MNTKNIKLAFLTRQKFGKIISKDCFKYFSKCEIKSLEASGYLVRCKHNLLDEKDNIITKDMNCIEFTDKFDKYMKKNGYKPKYSSNSASHDISLSQNAYLIGKELNCSITQYMCEAELSSSIENHSRVDGAFSTRCGVVAIEKITSSYTPTMIKSKQNYCLEKGYTLYLF